MRRKFYRKRKTRVFLRSVILQTWTFITRVFSNYFFAFAIIYFATDNKRFLSSSESTLSR